MIKEYLPITHPRTVEQEKTTFLISLRNKYHLLVIFCLGFSAIACSEGVSEEFEKIHTIDASIDSYEPDSVSDDFADPTDPCYQLAKCYESASPKGDTTDCSIAFCEKNYCDPSAKSCTVGCLEKLDDILYKIDCCAAGKICDNMPTNLQAGCLESHHLSPVCSTN